jgi:ABC-type branched-subunit amino acid transport system ATPase component/predicted MFS family arabinose efflux permease
MAKTHRSGFLSSIRDFRDSLGPAGLMPLAVLFGLNMVDEFDAVAFGALSPEIRNHFDLSNSSFILIASLSGALSILAAAPVGYLADKFNRVRFAQIAGLVWAFAALGTGLAPVLGLLIAARFVGGIGRLVNEPVHPSLLSDYYPPKSLPNVFAVHRFANIVGNIGGPVAGIIAAVFVSTRIDEWRPAFIILAVPTFLFLFFSLRLTEPKRGAHVAVDDLLSETATAVVQTFKFGEAYRRLKAIQSLKRTWIAAFFFGAGVIPLASFLSLFFDEVYGMGPFGRGMMVLLRGAGGAVGLLIGSRIARRLQAEDRMNTMPIVVGLMIIQFAAGMVLMAVTPWMVGSIFFAFFLAIGASGFLPPYLTQVALIAPPRIRSQAYAYSLFFFAVGGVVLSRFASAVGDDHGLRLGTAMLSGFVFVGGLVALTVSRFIRRDVEEAAKSMKAQEAAEAGTFLVCKGVDVAYDQVQVLFDVDFDVKEGEIVALLGTNGAGKSTLLKAISGLVDPIGGAIFFEGRDITHLDAETKAAMGIAQVPGGRGIFPSLTVGDNLRAAGWLYRSDAQYRKDAVERVLEYFPILRNRWDTQAGSLSGGEQQMLSLAQAFIAKPRLLVIDELSLGLAPTVVEMLLQIVRAIHEGGTTVVLVEQSVNTALKLAERAAFMEKGEVRFEGPTEELLSRPDILRAVFLKGGEGVATHTSTRAGTAGNGAVRTKRQASAHRLEILERPVVLQTHVLTKRYGGITAVDEVDLELHEGEILGLIGPNGAGKTTIFDLVSGFTAVDGGRIEFNGADVTHWTPSQRAEAGLGRSFQDARLWQALTVKEAIAVACERHVDITSPIPAIFSTPVARDSEADIQLEVEELIELLRLGAFRDKFVSELSTGSRRIVEIAAILAHRPSVVILDEPSSGIAQKETEALGPLLRQVRDHLGCSMLVIEHDMPLITKLAERMYGLEQGRIICEGTPDDVINHPAVIESYLGAEGYSDITGGTKPGRRRAAGSRGKTRKPARSR